MGTTDRLSDGQHRFLIRSVSIIVIGLFVNQLVHTGGSIVLARMITDPVRYGEANLLLNLVTLIYLFLNIGFNSALVYGFSVDSEEAKRTKFRLALVGSTVYGIGFGLVLLALAPLIASFYRIEALQGALSIVAVTTLFHSAVNIGIAAFSGSRSFGTQAIFMVVTTTFTTAGMAAGVLWPLRPDFVLPSIALWMGVGTAVAALVICWRVHRVHKPSWRGPLPWKDISEMLRYGVPMWAGNIFKAFQQPYLAMVLGSTSIVAVGFLTNASRITGFIGIVTWAFMIVTLPFVAEAASNRKESERRGTLCIRYNNFILYPLTLLICLYPNEINGFLFGESFTIGDSAVYTRLLAMGVFFSAFSRLGGNILAGTGRTRANFWAMIVSGIFVVALVPVVVGYSSTWAVWIYMLGWAISAVCMIGFFFLEQFSIGWRKAYVEPLLPTIMMGLLMEGGRLLDMFVPVFIAAGLLGMVGLTWWLEARALRRISGGQGVKNGHPGV